MRFQLLGEVQVEEDGARIRLPGRKQRAVLALLLLRANEPVGVDVLVDELWEEVPPSSARHTMQAYVSRLRAALNGHGREVVQTRPGGYLVRAGPEELDLLAFEELLGEGRRALAAGRHRSAHATLSAALALWRGEPLADLAGLSFAEREGARLHEERLAALEARADAALALGRGKELVAELRQLVAEEPFRERFRAQLMLALYRSGRHVEALAAYREHRDRLVAEVGLEPSVDLQRLQRQMLQRDPALEPAARSPAVDAGRPLRRAARRPSVGSTAYVAGRRRSRWPCSTSAPGKLLLDSPSPRMRSASPDGRIGDEIRSS